MTVDRTEQGAINPACRSIVEDSCDHVTDSGEHVQVSLMGAIGGITDGDTNMCADDYSVDSESEIFTTERRLELIRQDSPKRKMSETSDSSAVTDDDSFAAYYSDNDNYIDESVMWNTVSHNALIYIIHITLSSIRMIHITLSYI